MNLISFKNHKSLALVCLCALAVCLGYRLNGSAVAQTNNCGTFNWDARFAGEQGVNGVVQALAQSATGEVFVGGRFTRAGNVSANNIAYWQAATGWHALEQPSGGNGISGEVTAIAVSGDTVYVGGRFTQAGGVAVNHVARWTYRNGWQPLAGNDGNGVNGTGATQVFALTTLGEDLFVGGNFTQAGAGGANPLEVANVARWHPTRGWQTLAGSNGTGVNGYVTALLFNGEDLFVGGNFTRIANGTGAYNVVFWRAGQGWEPLHGRGGQGVYGGEVRALAWFNHELIVAGEFTEANIGNGTTFTAHHLARWSLRDGWRALADDNDGSEGVFGDPYALAVTNDTLYVAGRFSRAAASEVSNLAAWHPARGWQAVGAGLNAVSTVALADDCELYLGGAFTTAGGAGANRFARYAAGAPGPKVTPTPTPTPTPIRTPTPTPTPTPGNSPPTITPQPLTLQQGSAGGVFTLATISDAQTPAGSLQIQLSNPLLGVNVTEAANVNGAITARVVATCGAVLGAQALNLRVTDSGGASSSANLPLTILANNAPAVGNYATANVAAGATLAAMPSTNLSDNGFLTNLQASSATFNGTLSVAATTGVVTISNARPTGVHSVTLAATDNCGATTTRAFTLNVTRAETVTRLIAPNSVFTANQTVTLTANVASNVALGATSLPTGSIVLVEGATTLQRATLDAAGAARFTATVPASGLRELRAQYEGDAQYAASVSLLAVLSVASPFVSASAASYEAGVAAPEQILAAFGVRLSSATLTARTIPLPLVLNDLVLRVRDAAGVERLAPLFFVSPNQINYQLPAGTANGSAVLTLTPANDRNILLAAGAVQVINVVPGLFTADASGKGWPAAQLLRIAASGALSYEAIARYDDAQRGFVAVPINFGAATDQLFLVLFGTGLRGRANLSEVTATIGNTPVEVLFAGAQGGLVGVDQINLTLPRNLAGRGELDLKLTAQGKNANVVKLVFQ